MAPPTYNLSGSGVLGLEFWFYGDGRTYRVTVSSQAVTDYNYYGIQITPAPGQWTFYQVPFTSMFRQTGWSGQTGLPVTYQGTDCTGIWIFTQGTGAFNFQVDQIGFYTTAGIVTPTYSPTGTATGTASFTPTQTLVPTNPPTDTPTPTPTLTSTQTPTLTPTPTPTLTPTPSLTPTLTLTGTPTIASVDVLYPNPVIDNQPLRFYYNLDQPVDQVKAKLFTVSFRKIYEDATLPMSPGQHLYTLQWNQAGLNLANGLYYVDLVLRTGSRETHKVMKLLVVR